MVYNKKKLMDMCTYRINIISKKVKLHVSLSNHLDSSKSFFFPLIHINYILNRSFMNTNIYDYRAEKLQTLCINKYIKRFASRVVSRYPIYS